MSSARRRRLQRIALPVLGFLAAFVAVQQLIAAPHARHEVREEIEEIRVTNSAARGGAQAASGGVLFAHTFAVREGDRLNVDLRGERVEVLPAKGKEATVTVRGEGPRARRGFERSRFRASYSGGVLDVRTERRHRGGRHAARTVVIEVPARFSASVGVGSGSVRVERLDGDLRVDTGSGSVSVGAARGRRIALRTGSGSIRADALSGEVTLGTGSGSIQVGRVDGSFAGDTGSGFIRVGEADVDRFHADTGSGSVTARLLREAEVDVDTGSGRVRLTLPKASGAEVELSGRPILVDDALGFSGERRRDEVRGRLGAGGPEVEVSSGSGGIELLAR